MQWHVKSQRENGEVKETPVFGPASGTDLMGQWYNLAIEKNVSASFYLIGDGRVFGELHNVKNTSSETS